MRLGNSKDVDRVKTRTLLFLPWNVWKVAKQVICEWMQQKESWLHTALQLWYETAGMLTYFEFELVQKCMPTSSIWSLTSSFSNSLQKANTCLLFVLERSHPEKWKAPGCSRYMLDLVSTFQTSRAVWFHLSDLGQQPLEAGQADVWSQVVNIIHIFQLLATRCQNRTPLVVFWSPASVSFVSFPVFMTDCSFSRNIQTVTSWQFIAAAFFFT